MKYVMVDKTDSIVNRVELDSGVGVTGAKTYFVGVKNISENKFDKLWKVMSEKEYNDKYKAHIRNPSSVGYQWWIEENTNLDDF